MSLFLVLYSNHLVVFITLSVDYFIHSFFQIFIEKLLCPKHCCGTGDRVVIKIITVSSGGHIYFKKSAQALYIFTAVLSVKMGFYVDCPRCLPTSTLQHKS